MIAGFLGIPDPWIWMAYVLCLAATLLCVIYGVRHSAEEKPRAPDPGVPETGEKAVAHKA